MSEKEPTTTNASICYNVYCGESCRSAQYVEKMKERMNEK